MSGLDETLPLGAEEGGPASGPPQLGPYRLVRELARGGMGAVYEAIDTQGGGRCAVKTILDSGDPQANIRFRREAQLLARVSHPNVGTIRTANFDHEPAYLVQDLYHESLRDRLRKGPLPLEEAIDIAVKLAGALEHLHARGILHRDLKPHNVLFDERGEPRLVDLGLARDQSAEERLTRTGDILGTPKYMAPEQAYGDPADGRTDVYGLGGVLYAMLTGRAPFEGGAFHEVLDRLTREPPVDPRRLRAGLPRHVAGACLRALEKHPDDRYATPMELADALTRPGATYVSRGALLLLVLAAVVSIGGLLFFASSDSPRQEVPAAQPLAAEPPPDEPPAALLPWRLEQGDALALEFTRHLESERVVLALTLVLDVRVGPLAHLERALEVTLARVQLRCVPLPYSKELTGEFRYDSNYPTAVRGDRTAFNEASAALDVLRSEVFQLSVDPMGRVSSEGLDALRARVLAELPESLTTQDGISPWTRDETLRACAETFSDVTFPKALSALLQLPAAEGPEPTPGRARFGGGRFEWAVGRATQRGGGRTLRVVESLHSTRLNRALPKEEPGGKSDTLGDAARRLGSSLPRLAAANQLTDPNLVRVGNTFVAPPAERPDAYLGLVRVEAGVLPVYARRWGPWMGTTLNDRVYVLLERADPWVRIRWGGGWGWVRASGVRDDPGATALRMVSEKKLLLVQGEDANERIQGNLLGFTEPGKVFAAAGRLVPRPQQMGWAQIQFDDRLGWVRLENVERVE